MNWTVRYLSGVDDNLKSSDKLVTTTDGYFYNDLEGSVTYRSLTFTAGVRNIFDKEPPYVSDYQDMNTLNVSYDTAGRYFFVGLALAF